MARKNTRHLQCLKALDVLGEATANAVAMYLLNQGIVPYFSRNFTQPRLNELVRKGKVEMIGKKVDFTNRPCTLYRIKTI